ncbi:glycosyltransferase [Leptolyngbya sp. DQ-M1]|uniref:hypothetical protein n=1 Tax=Leptolyngbya sp. DQ-M1 TaxID=2933920 RepID=UPI0032996D4B
MNLSPTRPLKLPKQTPPVPTNAVLIDPFYPLDVNGHGGSRRTVQVIELLQKADIELSHLERKILRTQRDRYLTGISSVLNPNTLRFIVQNQLQIRSSLQSLAFCGFQRQVYHDELSHHQGSKLLLWETTKNYVAPYVAKAIGYRVIALPHNIEALIPRNDCCETLETEIASLGKADAVFCIAREEEWLLKAKGVNAFYLPYYPPDPILKDLATVRQARLTTQKQRFLILGTANNTPTLLGMIEQIEWLKQIQSTIEFEVDFEVDIVGYGTEQLSRYCDLPGFTVHGAVETKTLNQFLQSAKAVLVHQKAGVGALTRIPEMIMAGIPVIASSNACRSAFEYAGVYCYEDWRELAEWLSRDLAMPEVLPRPISAEQRLIEWVLQLAQAE